MTNDRAQHLAELPKLVHPNFRTRFANLLETKNGRHKLRSSLAHNFSCEPKMQFRFISGPPEPAAVYADLVRRGAPETCYVLSESSEWDDKIASLRDMILGDLIGSGQGTLLSCLPGRLGYFCGEELEDRYVIRAQN